MHASKGGYQKSCLELEKALGACHGIQGKGGLTGLARLHTSQGETI